MSYVKSIARFLQKWIVEFAVAIVAVAAVVVLHQYFSQFDGAKSSSQEVWGQFGDFVGGTLNPILGFVSVLVLVATLNLQRVELKESREVFKEGNYLLEMQLTPIHLQSLENTFFKMLDEFERNEVTLACKERECELGLFSAVYCYVTKGDKGITERGYDTKNEYFRVMTDGVVSFGAFKYMVVSKVINLLEIAGELDNNQIHYALIQSAVGPRLLSAVFHFIQHEFAEVYPKIRGAKRAFLGISPDLVFSDEVAKDFLRDKAYEKYVAGREGILSTREKALLAREKLKRKQRK